MSQRRDNEIPEESETESPEPLLRALVRLLGRQAAHETFVQPHFSTIESEGSRARPSWPAQSGKG